MLRRRNGWLVIVIIATIVAGCTLFANIRKTSSISNLVDPSSSSSAAASHTRDKDDRRVYKESEVDALSSSSYDYGPDLSGNNNSKRIVHFCNRTFDVSPVPNITGRWVPIIDGGVDKNTNATTTPPTTLTNKKWYDSQYCCGQFKQDSNCTKEHTRIGGHACIGQGPYQDLWTFIQSQEDGNENSDSCFSSTSSTFDKEEYCTEAIRNRRILMIGDSTMGQTFAVLRNALIDSSCHHLLSFKLSDLLIPEHHFQNRKERGKSLVTILEDYDSVENNVTKSSSSHPDIVIVTAGAHIQELCDFVYTLRYLKYRILPRYPTTQFVWKTQNPAGCSFPMRLTVFHPESPTLAATDIDGQNNHVYYTHPKQHQDQYWIRDQIAISYLTTSSSLSSSSSSSRRLPAPARLSTKANKATIASASSSSSSIITTTTTDITIEKAIQLLDVRYLYSRTDSHIFNLGSGGETNGPGGIPFDCLHYRSPGPLDQIVCSIYNLLSGI